MKSILYVGATLMIGASIYGFVDYEKTKNKKEFTDMYKEAEVTEPVIVSDRKLTNPVENKGIAVKEKSRVVKKQLAKMPIGTKLATYFAYSEEIPLSYTIISTHLEGKFKLWEKTL